MSVTTLINNLKISRKISALVAGSCLSMGIVLTGLSVYETQKHSLASMQQEVVKNSAADINTLKIYFQSIEDDLTASAHSALVLQAFKQLSDGWHALPAKTAEEKRTYLQKLYINDNPNKTGEKDKLDTATDGSLYSKTHTALHQHFKANKDSHAYYDEFLVDMDGNVIYTVFKEADFASNLNTGIAKDSDLAAVYREARNAAIGTTVFKDFKAYSPSNNAPAAFIGTPIADEKGGVAGVLIYQMPISRINAFFTDDASAMDKGSVDQGQYLVGQDGLLRVDIAGSKEDDILKTKFDLENVKDINKAHTGLIYKNAYTINTPMEYKGVKWNYVTEVNVDSFEKELREKIMSYIVKIVSIVVVLAAIAMYLGKKFAAPIVALAHTVEKLANGRNVEVAGRERADELGDLARSMTKIHELATEAARIRTAVDGSNSQMMIADTAGKIIYHNRAMLDLLRPSQHSISRDSGGSFDVNRMVGVAPELMFANNQDSAAVQRALKADGNAPQEIKVTFDNRHFTLVITPAHDASGGKIGTVLEWQENTAAVLKAADDLRQRQHEQNIENQINDVIESVAHGHLDVKLQVQDDRPFIQNLTNGINRICGIINQFMEDTVHVLEAMADGDLTRKIRTQYDGRFDDVKNNLNNAIDKTADVINQIVTVGHAIRNAGADVTQGADDLSGRTEAQAAGIEETVATMEEMSASVRTNANNATKANDMARETLRQAESGGEVVSNAVQAMSKIESGSQRITEIVGVIDAIASQTNLLALNAAVEAARAGDAGKGFAVVAAEVRTLASRCSEAARDIRALIVGSNGQVVEGVRLVHSAGDALQQIVSSVNTVAQTISAITAASREQATGVEEISNAIAQMDEMTQQNAALSDESAAAARSLREQAEQLSELVSIFKTGSISSLGGTVSALRQESTHFKQQLKSKPKKPSAASRLQAISGATAGSSALAANLNDFEDL